MEKINSKTLTLNLGKDNGKYKFTQLEDLLNWLLAEKSFYELFNVDPNREQNLIQMYRAIVKPANQLIASFIDRASNTQILEHETISQLNFDVLESLKAEIEKSYTLNKLILSTSGRGKYLQSLLLKSKSDAYVALASLLNVEVNNLSQLSFNNYEALIDAWAYKNGIKYHNTQRDVLEHLIAEMQTKISAIDALKNETELKIDTYISKVELDEIEREAAHQELISDQSGNLHQFIEDSRITLKNIEDAYDKKMALQASISYWENRELDHKNKSKKYMWIGIVFGLVSILIVYKLFDVMIGLEALKSSVNIPESMPSVNSPRFKLSGMPILAFSVLIFAISILVWIERILIRLLLSQLHLETDAGERVVMIKTYIAMLREGQTTKDDDRRVIIASLFRPNTTGIINDDALPFNLDSMQKIVGGKPS